MRSFAASSPEFIAVRFTRQDLAKRALPPNSNELWFRVSSSGPEDACTVKAENQQIPGQQALPVYSPAPGIQELVFWPNEIVNANAAAILWDVWVVPSWNNGNGLPHLVGIEPVGPTGYVCSGQSVMIPLSFPRNDQGKMVFPNHNATRWHMNYDYIRNQAGKAQTAALNNIPLLARPIAGHNYPSYMGRGMDNVWKLKFLANGWGIDQLQSVTAVFAYLQPVTTTTNFKIKKNFGQGLPKLRKIVPKKVNPNMDSHKKWLAIEQQIKQKTWQQMQQATESYQRDSKQSGFVSGPAGSAARLAQIERVLEWLPGFGAIFPPRQADNFPEHLPIAPKISKLPAMLPAAQQPLPALTERKIAEMVDAIIADEVVSISKLPSGRVIYPLPLCLLKDNVAKILNEYRAYLQQQEQKLAKTANTLEKANKPLQSGAQLAVAVNQADQKFRGQQRFVQLYADYLANKLTPALSRQDRKLLEDMVAWAVRHDSSAKIVQEKLAGNDRAFRYILAKLYKKWLQQLQQKAATPR